jgi:hypothetical protein
MTLFAKRALEAAKIFAENIYGSTNDASLRATAMEMDPAQLVALLKVAADADDAAAQAAKTARHRLNLLVTVGLERHDVNKQRMVEATGIPRRDLYKRPDRL